MAAGQHPYRASMASPSVKQGMEVALATLLVAGCPVAVVWWLRGTELVTSTPLALAIGMALSLLASYIGQVVWEKQSRSEDLLFNELMVWGYVHRLRKQRRLANTAGLLAPADRSVEAKERQKLLERLVAGMETRDPYLHGHSRRVARYSWLIAQHMKLPREEVLRIRAAAALHDVGKTKTPKTILHKAGRLSDEEYRIIKLHPGEGAQMVEVLGDSRLAAIIRHHHERLDGSGYPNGLSGEAIPLGARIIAVADTFDAITSARPYRAASPHKQAIDILHDEAGTRLDPAVVKAFRNIYAGRGPLALWSFASGLPERAVTWLSSSAGAVAAAAKVAAVAAVVGGAAATSSTLGLVAASSQPARAHHRAAAVVPAGALAPAAPSSPLFRSVATTQHGPRALRPGHHRRPVVVPVAVSPLANAHNGPGSVPTASRGVVVVPVATHEERTSAGGGASVKRVAGEESGSGLEETPAFGREVAKVKKEEVTGKKEEVKVKGKKEEAKGKKEQANLPREEAKVKGKKEEAKAKNEEAKGKPEEAKGKPEEAKGKPVKEEAAAKKSEEHGKGAEAPGHAKKEQAAAPAAEAPTGAKG